MFYVLNQNSENNIDTNTRNDNEGLTSNVDDNAYFAADCNVYQRDNAI